jgi:hypothetical protein
MFKVIFNDGTKDRHHYTVYDVRYDNTGYPHFIIYKDNSWLCMSAKHFKPVEAKTKL